MLIYNFAGCVMDGASFLQRFQPSNSTNARGISTEGILRLLTGETLSLSEHQLNKVLEKYPNYPKNFGTYAGITKIDGIIWTAVADAIYLTPLAQCQDKTTYPFHDSFLINILGTTGASLSLVAIKSLWTQLYKNTIELSKKIVVHYPTDYLLSGAWKERIDTLQQLTREIFIDWQHYTVNPELDESDTADGHWSHYSKAAKEQLWKQIEQNV